MKEVEEEQKLKGRRRQRSRLRITRRSRSLTRCRLGRLLHHLEVGGGVAGEVGEAGLVRAGGTGGRRRGRGMWLRLESRVGWG